jgi:demethylmenaquinone methyltransferase/2-methoxy-6-polyprenyl-1,4-benzoquinol methylase
MDIPRPVWFDRARRRQQLDEAIARSQQAAFGFRSMPAQEKSDWVRRHFDRVAPRYDFMNTLLSFGIQYAWKRQAIRLLGLQPGQRVIDVCGGTADLALMAARPIGPRGSVVVYDINMAMLRHGRPKAAGAGNGARIRFVQGDAEAICFPAGHFDAAMVGFGIRNVTRIRRAFGEMFRVLKPGGRFLCLEFSKPVNPVFRWLYDVYSFYIMPFLGRVCVGSWESYACLPETIRLFHLPDELSALLAEVGFQRIAYRRMTNGIAVAHLAVKPEREPPAPG